MCTRRQRSQNSTNCTVLAALEGAIRCTYMVSTYNNCTNCTVLAAVEGAVMRTRRQRTLTVLTVLF